MVGQFFVRRETLSFERSLPYRTLFSRTILSPQQAGRLMNNNGPQKVGGILCEIQDAVYREDFPEATATATEAARHRRRRSRPCFDSIS